MREQRKSKKLKKGKRSMETLVVQEEQAARLAYPRAMAARLIGISLRKLDQLIAEKEITTLKIGKSRLVSAEALRNFLRKAELAAR